MQMIVIAIAAIVLAIVEPPFRFVTTPKWVFLLTGVVTLVPAIAAFAASRRALRVLESDPADPNRGQAAFGRGLTIAQTLLGLGFAGLLLLTDWLTICHRLPTVGGWPLVGEIAALAPFVLAVLLMWIAAYPADRAIRQIAFELYLFRGRPTRPVWDLFNFLIFNLRHQVLFILLPMLLVLAARDIIAMYDRPLQRLLPGGFVSDFALGVVTVLVAVIAPELLRHIWTTKRLPEGPLRDKLIVLCRKLRMRYREILVWRTGGMLVNAAVMGVIAPFRYVLVTDGMLEQMEDRKIEAVFGHEAGHVKRHHITFFLLFALISGSLFTVASIRMARLDRATYQVLSTILGAALFVKWSIVFGWVSRKFERQADIFGVRTLVLAELPCDRPCALHGEDSGPPDAPAHTMARTPLAEASGVFSPALVSGGGSAEDGDRLCSSAAHLFGDTLYQVAHLNGIPPEARSWRHGSIASRSRTLQRYAADPLETARFERQVWRIKVMIFLVALASSLWAAYELKLWRLTRLFQ